MIAYIKGQLMQAEEDFIVIENGAIGYQIFVTAQTLDRLPPLGSDMKIHTYMYVREDVLSLYGFLTRDDMEIFKLLLGVSGIGPKGAMGILSALSADELRFAVLSEDSKTISKAPGIGAKTAQRLIIELKDKLKLQDAFEKKLEHEMEHAGNTVEVSAKSEAVQALSALGYSNAEALQAVRKVDITEDMDTEAILKEALKKLSFL